MSAEIFELVVVIEGRHLAAHAAEHIAAGVPFDEIEMRELDALRSVIGYELYERDINEPAQVIQGL